MGKEWELFFEGSRGEGRAAIDYPPGLSGEDFDEIWNDGC
jgi:hypothetical protein